MGGNQFLSTYRGVKLIFTRGHIRLAVACKGQNVILQLYKCNCSLTVRQNSSLPPGRNKVEGQIWLAGLVFATCALEVWIH